MYAYICKRTRMHIVYCTYYMHPQYTIHTYLYACACTCTTHKYLCVCTLGIHTYSMCMYGTSACTYALYICIHVAYSCLHVQTYCIQCKHSERLAVNELKYRNLYTIPHVWNFRLKVPINACFIA